MYEKGWLDREFKAIKADQKTWPYWMKPQQPKTEPSDKTSLNSTKAIDSPDDTQ